MEAFIALREESDTLAGSEKKLAAEKDELTKSLKDIQAKSRALE